MHKVTLLFLGLLLTGTASFARGVGADISTAVSAVSAAGIAKNLANPISNMVAVPIQYNFDRGIGQDGAGNNQTVTLQPVVPINLSGGNNFIVRPIVSAAIQNNVDGFSGTGVGNIQLETFYTPKSDSSFTWGIGPYLIAPSASGARFGSAQTGAGISAVGLTQSGPWTAGLLLVRSWAIAGSNENGTVNNLYYQPFISYRTKDSWTFGVDLESSFNYDVRRTASQITASVSKLVMIGDQPISFAFGPKYNVGSVPGGPEGWGARATVTFIFSK